MVKKVGGSKPPGTTSTTPVQSSKTVESAKVGGVGDVQATEKQAAATGVRATLRGLSAEQREQLLQMVDEEADNIFGVHGLPEAKKETVKGAVKMAITASIADHDETEPTTPPKSKK